MIFLFIVDNFKYLNLLILFMKFKGLEAFVKIFQDDCSFKVDDNFLIAYSCRGIVELIQGTIRLVVDEE